MFRRSLLVQLACRVTGVLSVWSPRRLVDTTIDFSATEIDAPVYAQMEAEFDARWEYFSALRSRDGELGKCGHSAAEQAHGPVRRSAMDACAYIPGPFIFDSLEVFPGMSLCLFEHCLPCAVREVSSTLFAHKLVARVELATGHLSVMYMIHCAYFSSRLAFVAF